MLNVTVKHDLARLSRDLTRMQRRHIPRAAQQAVNRAAASARAEAAKAIAREAGIKQKDGRAALTLKKAHSGSLTAVLAARGRPLNLIRFAARQVKAGVKAAPWRRRRLYAGAFIPAQQHPGSRYNVVFRRKGRARTPIVAMVGPSVPKELVKKAAREAVTGRFAERFRVEFPRALRNLLRRTAR